MRPWTRIARGATPRRPHPRTCALPERTSSAHRRHQLQRTRQLRQHPSGRRSSWTPPPRLRSRSRWSPSDRRKTRHTAGSAAGPASAARPASAFRFHLARARRGSGRGATTGRRLRALRRVLRGAAETAHGQHRKQPGQGCGARIHCPSVVHLYHQRDEMDPFLPTCSLGQTCIF